MIDFIAPEMEFTGFMFATILFLFAAMFLVIRNKVLAHDPRNTFVVTLTAVAVITLIDWFNYLSVGYPEFVWFQRISMALSFTVAPTLPVLVAHTLADDPVPFKVVVAIIALQGLLELATIFGGYVFYVDANNYYHRGPLYNLYTLTYIASALYLTKQVIVIGTTYQTASLRSMLIILVVFFSGVAIQIPFPNVRITWLCVSMSVVLFILFYIEMVITADPLTMLLNRTVYNRFLESPTFPFTYVILDVNRFKQVNDTYGHAFGDLCLKTLSQEILKTYAPYGRCYRIGGDEFAVILTPRTATPSPSRTRSGTASTRYARRTGASPRSPSAMPRQDLSAPTSKLSSSWPTSTCTSTSATAGSTSSDSCPQRPILREDFGCESTHANPRDIRLMPCSIRHSKRAIKGGPPRSCEGDLPFSLY